jgi:hypothetical protein
MQPNATLPASHSVSHNPLPSSWIAKIFEEMSASYGSKFADLWAGSNMEAVQRKWSEKLGGFRDMPGAIREALDALDSKPFPPTLPEFLVLCREAGRRHSAPVQAIGYMPTPEEQAKAAEIIAKAADRMTVTDKRDHKSWAKKLKERHEAGEVLSLSQVRAYQEALA